MAKSWQKGKKRREPDKMPELTLRGRTSFHLGEEEGLELKEKTVKFKRYRQCVGNLA